MIQQAIDYIKGLVIAPIRKRSIPLEKRQHCLYHQVKRGTDCPDGIAAAWAVYRALPRINLIGCVYGDPIPRGVKPGDEVYVVDFSFPANQIRKWLRQRVQVTIVDHHKTALNDLSVFCSAVYARAGNPEILIMMTESGATLAWRHFHPGAPVPWFLKYVKDRDLWQWKLPQSKEINEGLAVLRQQSKDPLRLFDDLFNLPESQGFETVLETGVPAYKKKIAAVMAAADRAKFEWTPDGKGVTRYYVPVARLSAAEARLASDVANELLKRNPVKFAACITPGGKWSLRSDRDGLNFDVESVAKQYGGGGHHNAAGFLIAEAED